jgi:hypothetical protein
MSASDSEVSNHSAEASDSESVTYAEQQQYIINLLKGTTYTIPYLDKTLKGWYMGVNPAYEKIKAGEDAFLKK